MKHTPHQTFTYTWDNDLIRLHTEPEPTAQKSKLQEAVEGIRWIAQSQGDDRTMLSTLESIQSRAITAIKEHRPQPTEEERAKAALEDGWLWNGQKTVIGRTGNPHPDIMYFSPSLQRWSGPAFGDSESYFTALRAGSEIARKNGLEPDMGIPASAYPPPESTWPAKPDPGVGYRELGPDEVIQEGDELCDNGNDWYLADIGIGTTPEYQAARARRRIKASEPVVEADPWRDMLPEEIIEECDEIDHGDGCYEKAFGINLIGKTVEDAVAAVSWRKFRTRRPLVTVDPVSGVTVPKIGDLIHRIEIAWGIIANAHGGNWEEASKDWQEAANRWRDEMFNRTLDECGGHSQARALIARDEAPPAERKAREWPGTTYDGGLVQLDGEDFPASNLKVIVREVTAP